MISFIAVPVGQNTVELYINYEAVYKYRSSIPTDGMAQAQQLDPVILDWLAYSRHRIALVELTCPWDTDAEMGEYCKTSEYANLKVALSNEGSDCSLYMIEV
jgi:hypothetical protein